jgi:hypothetical protein
MQMFVDSVVLTTNPQFDPATGSSWETVVESGITSSDATSFAVDGAAIVEGDYRWRVQVFDGDLLVSADGSVGVWSDAKEFRAASGPP